MTNFSISWGGGLSLTSPPRYYTSALGDKPGVVVKYEKTCIYDEIWKKNM